MYQRFINAIHKSETLKQVQIFVDFIKLSDRTDWITATKRVDKQKVFNVMTESGNMDVKYNARNYAFTS